MDPRVKPEDDSELFHVIPRLDRGIHAPLRQLTDPQRKPTHLEQQLPHLTRTRRELHQRGLRLDLHPGTAAVIGVGLEPVGLLLQGVMPHQVVHQTRFSLSHR